MEKTNKQVIEEFTLYLLKHSNFETVARAFANCMIDYHRIANLSSIGDNEYYFLQARIKSNSQQIMKFAKEGGTGEFKLINIADL